MPQLDSFTWLHQVFIILITFTLLFFLIFLIFIPSLFGVLKSRKKLIIYRIFIIIFINILINFNIKEQLLNLQAFILNHLIIAWLLNINYKNSIIIYWLFKNTNLLLDLEILLVKKEQLFYI
jgi:hypothetical protein